MTLLGKALITIGFIGSALFFLNGAMPGKEINDTIIKKEILTGSTFSVLAREAGIATSTANSILASAKGVYDLARITAGKEIALIYDGTTGVFKKLVYEIDNEELLEIENISTSTEEIWQAEKLPIEYQTEISQASGVINNSLYETVVGQGLDQRLALSLAEMFAWQIDFAGEIQNGDSFKVIYEKKFRDGIYDHPGKILTAEFTTSGEKSLGFYFKGVESKEGYYDEKGNSLQKVFLKAPVQYKYISSGFSYRRINPVLGGVSAHRGIDYAAPSGTPIVSVGDGAVIQAGWNGQYGISVKVRHNETYTTVYGHFSGLAKGIRTGAKVKQGQIIGYVGSTGLSTGPHLHYEMHKFGSFINPFIEKIPAGEAVKAVDLVDFNSAKDSYLIQLNQI